MVGQPRYRFAALHSHWPVADLCVPSADVTDQGEGQALFCPSFRRTENERNPAVWNSSETMNAPQLPETRLQLRFGRKCNQKN